LPIIKVLGEDGEYYEAGGIGNIEDAKDYADQLKAETDSVLESMQSSLDNLDEYIEGAFSDSIISIIEAEKIALYINQLESDKAKLDAQYLEIHSDPDLPAVNKTALETAKGEYDIAYSDLIAIINSIILDKEITDEERQNYEDTYQRYLDEMSVLSSVMQVCVNEIARAYMDTQLDPVIEQVETNTSNISKNSEQINLRVTKETYEFDMSELQTDITGLSDSLADLDEYIDTSFKDGIIYDAEYRKIQSYLNTLDASKKDYDNQYQVVYGNAFLDESDVKTSLFNAKTDYDTRYTELIDKINQVISDQLVSGTESAEVDTAFTNYNNAISVLVSVLARAVDEIAQLMANRAENNAKGHTDDSIAPVLQRLQSAELKIEADAIISTVTESTTYQTDISNIVYKAEIISSNGNVFKNGAVSTTLECRVYHGSSDVTSTINASRFKWTRVSNDPDSDAIWNAQNAGGVKSITLTTDDVYQRATFNCEILDA
jgi:hypothetical protein